ncbi:kinase-like protein [Mytilinidion resinicola]|uniref:Kinase-like protein n=1 Tax=Mytilinidion resinicola TaxID=574789 RepID=A0A6A6Z5A7_9PEZI|nr:kinase-like protein [Mytilinidion resinicola]KAF2815437.1 kinase-like protein [Mytilinidion resinicola]
MRSINSHKTIHRYNARTWKQTKTLGKGGEGTADLHTSRWNKETKLVIKVVKMPDTTGSDNRPIELIRLACLPSTCNRIVELLGSELHTPSPGLCSLFLEYCPMGDVRHWRITEYENKNRKPVPETMIWRFFIQMSQALAFLHQGVGMVDTDGNAYVGWTSLIHRDIKPCNILVKANKGSIYPSFKLADFGISKFHDPSKTETEAGTYLWQPPELPRVSTREADVWSVGACVHYLATGKAPVEEQQEFIHRKWASWGHKYPTGVDAKDRHYWDKQCPRRPTHINVSKEAQLEAGVEKGKLRQQYSDELDKWMMKALNMKATQRPWAVDLLKGVERDGRRLIKKMSKASGLVDLEMKCEPVPMDDPDSDSNDGGFVAMMLDEDELNFDEPDMDPSTNYRGRKPR